jgi:putative ABC transport system ATP-binding protein
MDVFPPLHPLIPTLHPFFQPLVRKHAHFHHEPIYLPIRARDALEKEQSMEELVNVEAVSRRFALDNMPTHHPAHSFVSALTNASLRVSAGEFLAISGPSGSGKTTLLNLIGCIDQPTTGRIHVDGVDTSRLKPSSMSKLRREKIGFVFQTFNLIPVFTAAENVEYPLLVQGVSSRERRERVAEALESVGLSARANQRPDLLSGGERQRVAVARAIVHRPALVLADEPTANLDTDNGRQVMEIMQKLNKDTGVTFVFATHDPRVIKYARRVVTLRDGLIVDNNGNSAKS